MVAILTGNACADGTPEPELPADVARRYGVDGSDAATLASLADARVARFATALRVKRVENLTSILGRTIDHLLARRDLQVVAWEFWRACPPGTDPTHDHLASAEGFVRYVRCMGDVPAWLGDLAAVEFTIGELTFNAAEPRWSPVSTAEAMAGRRLRTSPNARLLTVQWDVLRLLGGGGGTAVAEVDRPAAPTHLVFQWRPGAGVRCFSVSAATSDLLAAAACRVGDAVELADRYAGPPESWACVLDGALRQGLLVGAVDA